MINADAHLREEIERDDSIVVSLVQLQHDGDYYRFADTPEAIDALLDPSTNVTTRFEPLEDEISVIGLPEQSDSPSRDLHQIGLFDPNDVWADRFLDSYTRLLLDLYICFRRANVNEYTRTLHVYSGRGIQAIRRFDEDTMQLLITFGGELTQIDAEFSAITTHQNQLLRNPLDQSLAFAGKLRTIDWGGTGAVDDDVQPFVRGRTQYGITRSSVSSGLAGGQTYTAPAVDVDLNDVFGGGNLTFSPTSGSVRLNAVSVTVPSSPGDNTYSAAYRATVTATNSAGTITVVLWNRVSITTFDR